MRMKRPSWGASVRISGEGQPSGEAQTDKEGRFSFKQVCEGAVNLFAYSNQGNGNTSAQGGDTNVVLQFGQRSAVYSSGENQRRLRGVVTDPDGKPVVGAKVAAFPSSSGSGEWFTTKEGGAYDIRWSAQSWQLESGDPLLIVRLAERNLAAAETFSAENTNLNVQLKPAWTLHGKVEDANAKPLAKSRMTLRVSAGRMSANVENRELMTDAEGKFEFKAVPPGPRYTIEASLKGYGRVNRPVESEKESGEVVLDRFVLNLADQIVMGQVVGTDEKPASGVHVQILGDGQPQVYEPTDKNGRFKFNVCEGEVRLHANGNNSYGEATVNAGETNVIINLQSYDTGIRRQVSRATLKGKPLPDCAAFGFGPGAIPAGKPVLLCLVDAEQRPSRRAARLLGEQSAALQAKGIAAAMHPGVPAEDSAFTEWTNSAALPFAVGRVTEKTPGTAWVTGVKSLPWLLLTDSKGIVVAEGFPVEELDAKLAGLK